MKEMRQWTNDKGFAHPSKSPTVQKIRKHIPDFEIDNRFEQTHHQDIQ